jgi:hypothetical protein
LFDHSFHQMGTDESGTTGNEDVLCIGHSYKGSRVPEFQSSKVPEFQLVTEMVTERSRSEIEVQVGTLELWNPGTLTRFYNSFKIIKSTLQTFGTRHLWLPA